MKEKIILIVILTSVVGLLFHHQSQDSNTSLTSDFEDLSLPTEIPLPDMELTQVGQNMPVEELTEMVQCEDSTTTTDNLSFKDAFTHFRNCLGSNQEFSWKGKAYLTLLAEEVQNIDIHQVADSTVVEKINNNDLEVVNR